MTDKQKRHQVEDRGKFSEDEKEEVALKSDHKCVWCGKPVYFNYGATVDHYIPLKKGGTNDAVNLVLMCNECNQRKSSKIVPLNIAARYLKEPYRSELGHYFEDYLENFDYISRGNLLGCDFYEMCLMPPQVSRMYKTNSKKKKDAAMYLCNKPSNIMLARAYPDDEDKLVSYFIKYLTRYNHLESDEAARQNIRFWMRFGTIYFVEQNNEISLMVTVLVNKHGFISMNVFSYYANPKSFSLANGVLHCLTDAMLSENNLYYIPYSVNILADDKLSARLVMGSYVTLVDGRMLCGCFSAYSDEADEEHIVEWYTRWVNFFAKFKDIEDEVQLYLYNTSGFSYSWMADEILGREFALEYFSPIVAVKDSKS